MARSPQQVSIHVRDSSERKDEGVSKHHRHRDEEKHRSSESKSSRHKHKHHKHKHRKKHRKGHAEASTDEVASDYCDGGSIDPAQRGGRLEDVPKSVAELVDAESRLACEDAGSTFFCEGMQVEANVTRLNVEAQQILQDSVPGAPNSHELDDEMEEGEILDDDMESGEAQFEAVQVESIQARGSMQTSNDTNGNVTGDIQVIAPADVGTESVKGNLKIDNLNEPRSADTFSDKGESPKSGSPRIDKVDVEQKTEASLSPAKGRNSSSSHLSTERGTEASRRSRSRESEWYSRNLRESSRRNEHGRRSMSRDIAYDSRNAKINHDKTERDRRSRSRDAYNGSRHLLDDSLRLREGAYDKLDSRARHDGRRSRSRDRGRYEHVDRRRSPSRIGRGNPDRRRSRSASRIARDKSDRRRSRSTSQTGRDNPDRRRSRSTSRTGRGNPDRRRSRSASRTGRDNIERGRSRSRGGYGEHLDKKRRSRSRESSRDRDRRRRSVSRSGRDHMNRRRSMSRGGYGEHAEKRRRSRSKEGFHDRRVNEPGSYGSGKQARGGGWDKVSHGQLKHKFVDGNTREVEATMRKNIREEENEEEYQDSASLHSEDEDVDREVERIRKRRQAIVEKHKRQEQQESIRNLDLNVGLDPIMGTSDSTGDAKVLLDENASVVSDYSKKEFNLDKGSLQNGLPDRPSGTRGLGEGTPKSEEKSNDMFNDYIFGESPAERRKQVKGDGLALETSGLTDNWDDAEGYYCHRIGEVMDGRYEIAASHGRGVFSSVVRARDLKVTRKDMEEVAIKIIRNNDVMLKSGQQELSILRKLDGADPENRRHCVRFLTNFDYRKHLCLVFESMHMNLREVLKKFGRNIGLNLGAVRAYAKQLFIALKHLRNCGVLHCDIKPDNMLVNESKNVLKLCDFGSAMFAGENEITPYLVSRFYRAPEIILGLPYDHPLDMWSVGCCLYEFFTGKVLFPGPTNNDMLRLHMELKGPFPKKMLKKAGFVSKHFDQDYNFCAIEEDPVTKASIKRVLVNVKPKDIASLVTGQGTADENGKMLNNFRDLLDKIFMLDPEKRLTVSQALSHPFITGK